MSRRKSSTTSSQSKMSSRPKMETKEELMEYLEKASLVGLELPFVEEAWEKAVEAYERQSDQEPEYIIVTRQDGDEVKTRRYPKNLRLNPISGYFRNMGLKRYKDMARQISYQEMMKYQPETATIMDTYFEGETVQTFDWFAGWIDAFPPAEREYLKQRYANYYEQYDINEGADKTVLMNILGIEVQLYKCNLDVARGLKVDPTMTIKLNENLIKLLDAQKWTKKQRSRSDEMAQNKFTIWQDKQIKNGSFQPTKAHYEDDDVDKLLNTFIVSMREVFDGSDS